MRIYNWKQFNESISFDNSRQNLSDILESLTVLEDNILQSIKAEEEDVFKMFNHLNRDSSDNIEDIINNPKFNDTLAKNGLRKTEIQDTSDFETFLKHSIKFVPIFRVDSNDLMNPIYLLIKSDKWDTVKLFRVNDNIKKFYDKLSSKTIELIYNNESYIYETSNSGNNWDLKNIEQKNDMFGDTITGDELKDLLNTNDIEINII
jgi:hypothetical protein